MMKKLNTCFVKGTAAAALLVFVFAQWRITDGLSAGQVIPALMLGGILWILSRKMSVLSDRAADRLTAVLFAVLVFVQLLLILGLYRDYLPGVDALSVFSEAVRMAEMDHPVLGLAGRYFEMYGNNYFWTILLCWYLKLFRLLGLTAYWMEALFLNMLALDAGVLLGVGSIRKCLNRQNGLMFMLLCCLNPVLYIFLPYVYTNTVSIPFTIGVFYFAWSLLKEAERGKQRAYAVSLAAVLALGMQIRITVWIPFIAMMIYCLVREENTGLFCGWKKGAAVLVLPLIVFFALYGGCKLLIQTTVPEEIRDENFPVVHWMMMGLKGEGGYSSADQEYTYSFSGKEAKREADMAEIRRRVRALADSGPSGILLFLKQKFCLTWETDMDGYYSEVGPVQAYHKLHRYLNGGGNAWLEFYYQMYKVMVYGFCIFGIVAEIRKRRVTCRYPYLLTILGFAIFYLLWEANFRYTVCMTLVFGSLAVPGFEELSEITEKLPGKDRYRFVGPVLMALLIFGTGIAWRGSALHEREADRTEYVIHTYFRDFHDKWIENIANERKVVHQTFVTDHPFDQVRLYVRFGDKTSNESMPYRFRLLDGSQNVLVDRAFGPEWENDDDYKSFGFDRVIPDGKTEYAIEISANPEEPDAAESMELVYFDFDTYDYVKNAELSIDGQRMNRDLVFQVADRQQTEE